MWVAFGIVAVSIKSTAWTAAVLGVFQQSRGLALGLTLSGTAVAQIVVRLSDVLPSGEVLRVSYQVLNLTHRNSHSNPNNFQKN